MATEKLVLAAGFIVYRILKPAGTIQYLLLQHTPNKFGPGGHWTPPKGHVDPGEVELDTAFRETQEESGITKQDLILIEDFQRTIKYEVKGKPKSVKYWLARVKDNDVKVRLSSEHQASSWFELDEAVKNSGYKEMQEIIRDADKFIKALPK